MASLYKSDGRWVVESYQRGKIRCGTNKAVARQVHTHVDQLEQCIKFATPIPDSTLTWIRSVDQKLRDRLTKLKLIAPFKHRTISDLISAFRQSKKSLTTTNEQTIKSLEAFFGAGEPLDSITELDAEKFRSWLLTDGRVYPKKGKETDTKGLAQATAAGRIKNARQMFGIAKRSKWIQDNPFNGVVAGKQNNPERSFFVKPELAEQIIDELPRIELKLIFALGRWAGFRIPSEAEHLRWTDINWERNSITFHTPKTRHVKGFEFRTCPIFHELRPWLELAWDNAEEGAIYCCPWLRSTTSPGQSFTKQMKLALKRLGLAPWPKLLNNLRATRATEVNNRFGSKAESEWIGHGVEVAMAHYLMVTDETWANAVKSPETASNSESVSSEK